MRLHLHRTFRLQNALWLAIPLPLWWTLRNIPSQDIWTILSGLSLGSLLVLGGLNAIILALFSSRWWLILRAQGYSRPYLALVGYRLAAFGVTYFTPGPQIGGEPLQVYLLQRRQGVPAATAAASVTLDKLLELLANFSFLLAGISTILATGLLGGRLPLQAFVLALGLLGLPIGYLLVLWLGRLPVSWMLARLSGRFASSKLNKAREFIASAETQVAGFCQTQPRAILQALALSLLIWAALILEFSLVLHFLGLRLNLPQTITVLTAARIAFLLPVPAGLGTLEAGQVLAMQALGMNPALGISISLLIRARDVFLGGIGLWWGGVLSR
jgi:uncharacterized protein (TIRG00374 family)